MLESIEKLASQCSPLAYYFGGTNMESSRPNAALIAEAIWILGGCDPDFDFERVKTQAGKLSGEAIHEFVGEIHYKFELLFWVFFDHPSFEPWHRALDCAFHLNPRALRKTGKDKEAAFQEYLEFEAAVGGIKWPPQHPDVQRAWQCLFLKEEVANAELEEDWEAWSALSFQVLDFEPDFKPNFE